MECLEEIKMTENQSYIKNLTESDADQIQQLLYNKIGIGKDNLDWVYKELNEIRKTENSILYNIIKDYYNLTSRKNIITISIKFFQLKYGILKKKKQIVKPQEIVNDIVIPFEDTTLTLKGRIGHGYLPIRAYSLDKLHTKFAKHDF